MLSRAPPFHVSPHQITTVKYTTHCSSHSTSIINPPHTHSSHIQLILTEFLTEFASKMASVLFRTGSGSITSSPLTGSLTGSPGFSLPLRHDSFSGGDKLHFEVKSRRRISRAISESQTLFRLKSVGAGSQTFPETLPEVPDEDVIIGGIGSLKFAEKCFDRIIEIPAGRIASEEEQFTGFGSGSGRDRGGFGSGRSSGGNNNSNERSKIGAHYRKLLESSPNDPLLLRNYGKFVHEVEGDAVKAEEYYGRAILASPGDGELLSLYGKLIWDAERDGERAQHYFDQAINASPDDCTVMGSYAQFMWEAEEDENEEEQSGSKACSSTSDLMVAAF
ncbi:hypothetical protein SSX86_004897 [Deinandra increscens subsp. villosa]|uniref:TmcB/TmcC TPR repeats domain-containing protein n=1 Tax=Deinandra increscens subsp. villosa TaxID=3103831 RepID=A0AAP0DP00_9ASTR